MKAISDRINIRQMKASDKEAVIHVINTSFFRSGDRQHSDPMFRNRADDFRSWEVSRSYAKREDFSGTLVAERDSHVQGMISYGIQEHTPELRIGSIGFFAVDRRAQGMGIGKKLTAAVREKLMLQKITFGCVHTDASAFLAIKTYESIGLKIYDLEMVNTIQTSKLANIERREDIILKELSSNQIQLVQEIDLAAFKLYEFFIHKEFPVQKYNEYLKGKIISKERFEEINSDAEAFLLAYKGKELVGYCCIHPKKEFSEFFQKQIVDLKIRVFRTDDYKAVMIAAIKRLEERDVQIVDILIRYLDQPEFDAVQDLGFRLLHCPICMGGKINDSRNTGGKL